MRNEHGVEPAHTIARECGADRGRARPRVYEHAGALRRDEDRVALADIEHHDARFGRDRAPDREHDACRDREPDGRTRKSRTGRRPPRPHRSPNERDRRRERSGPRTDQHHRVVDTGQQVRGLSGCIAGGSGRG